MKTNLLYLVLLFNIGTITNGCSEFSPPSVPTNRELATQTLMVSGDNRSQLEEVIEYYQTIDPDKDKLEAVYYLIGNMPHHYVSASTTDSLSAARLGEIAILGDPCGWDPYLSTTSRWLDSVNATTNTRYGGRKDLYNITADYLIQNIDNAFEQWHRMAWSRNYTFGEFCEWVLPYRTGNERLEEWRALALSKACEKEDSVRKSGNLFDLSVLLINNTGIYYNIGMAKYPLPLTFSDMEIVKRGSCEHMADYALKLFRSRGIPSALDVIPTWANRRNGHVWNAIVLPNGKSRAISYHPDGKNTMVYKVSKIYRQRYSQMREDILYKLQKDETIPDFFSGFDREDVTGQYDMLVSDIPVSDLRRSDHKLAWLCTFDNSQWIPVAYAPCVKGRKALFKDMAQGVLPDDNEPIGYINDGKGIVYLPAYYEFKQAVPASSPRILHEDGTIEILTVDTTHKQTLTINRKYPKHPHFDEYERGMIGGRIEAANKIDFSDAVTLLTIDKQQVWQMERLSVSSDLSNTSYRYVRYIAPENNTGNVAELMFYNHTAPLAGKPIGVLGDLPERGPAALFDGNMESFYLTWDKDSVWAGLDLGVPQPITEVAFAALTDDNEIRHNDTYQLFYWHDGWQPLPPIVAKDYRLTWHEVPSNTLYLMRNLSRGAEHRPFTYENGIQVWW